MSDNSTESGGTRDPFAPGGPDEGADPLKKEFPDPASTADDADDERPPLGFPDPDEPDPDEPDPDRPDADERDPG
jgi:hypothetical protein